MNNVEIQTDPGLLLVKLEKENLHAKKIISVLDERAGPAIVDSSSSGRSSIASISPVEAMVQQRDTEFASQFPYLTNVSYLSTKHV